jgi:hypothetical protein
MRMHLDLWAQELRDQGMSDADAEAAALRRFGDLRAYQDYVASRAERKARWQRIAANARAKSAFASLSERRRRP